MRSVLPRSVAANPDEPPAVRPASFECAVSTAERFVLWALRQWRVELDAYDRTRAGGQVESLLVQGFTKAGLIDALPAFASAMDAILHGTRRPLAIHDPRCAGASRDEAMFVALLGLAQRRLDGRLAACAMSLFDPGYAVVVVHRLTSFAALLDAAGLGIGPRPGDAGSLLQ